MQVQQNEESLHRDMHEKSSLRKECELLQSNLNAVQLQLNTLQGHYTEGMPAITNSLSSMQKLVII